VYIIDSLTTLYHLPLTIFVMKLCNEVEDSLATLARGYCLSQATSIFSRIVGQPMMNIHLLMHDPANDYYISSYHTRDNVNSHLVHGGYGIITNWLTAREGYGIA